MKKVTRATIKSFIKKNRENLYIKNIHTFDGMIDGTRHMKNPQFEKVSRPERDEAGFTVKDREKYTLGVPGAWFVGSSRDYFKPYEDSQYTGYEVYNACGNFILAINK